MAKLYEDKGMPYQIKDGEAGKWMQFWEILFPGKPRPATPCKALFSFLPPAVRTQPMAWPVGAIPQGPGPSDRCY